MFRTVPLQSADFYIRSARLNKKALTDLEDQKEPESNKEQDQEHSQEKKEDLEHDLKEVTEILPNNDKASVFSIIKKQKTKWLDTQTTQKNSIQKDQTNLRNINDEFLSLEPSKETDKSKEKIKESKFGLDARKYNNLTSSSLSSNGLLKTLNLMKEPSFKNKIKSHINHPRRQSGGKSLTHPPESLFIEEPTLETPFCHPLHSFCRYLGNHIRQLHNTFIVRM